MGARSGEPVGGESGPVGGTGSANGWRCSSSRRTTACLLKTNGPHGTFCAAAHRPCDPGGTHGGRVRRGVVGRGEPATPTRTGRRCAPAVRGGRRRPSCPAVGARTYPGVLPGAPAPALAPDGPSKGPKKLVARRVSCRLACRLLLGSPRRTRSAHPDPPRPSPPCCPRRSPIPGCRTSSRPPDGTSPSRARPGCGPSSPRRSRPTPGEGGAVGGAGAPVLVVTRHRARGRGADHRGGRAALPRRGRPPAELGDAAPRAALPARRHRRAPRRRDAPAGPPGGAGHPGRPAARRRHGHPQPHPARRARARRPRAGAPGRGHRVRARGAHRPPRRPRLRARRDGGEARRVRGARRHRRPLPAHGRGAGARGVLGRRGLRAALLLRRRPALAAG